MIPGACAKVAGLAATGCSSRRGRERGRPSRDEADAGQGADRPPRATVFGEAEMIVKVKEPQPEEVARLRSR